MNDLIKEKENLILSLLERKDRELEFLINKYTKDDKGNPLTPRDLFYDFKNKLDSFIKDEKESKIIVLTGLRGVGKTTLILQLYDYLRTKIPNKNLLFVSADELFDLNISLTEFIKAYFKYVLNAEFFEIKEKVFIFIDEAHYDKKWDLLGKLVYDKTDNVFVVFTGSSALSLEMGLDLVRRAEKLTLYPLNFYEYLRISKINVFKEIKKTELTYRIENLLFNGVFEGLKGYNVLGLRKYWEEFLLFGSFPFCLSLNKKECLEKVFNILERVIYKDLSLIKSFDSQNLGLILKILIFLGIKKVGETSENKLSNYFGVSVSLIHNVLNVLEKSRIIYGISARNSKKLIRKPKKYYFSSPLFLTAIQERFYSTNKGDLLSNALETFVFNQLMKLSSKKIFSIYYEDKGVDFVLDFGDRLIPIEVGIGKKDKTQIKRFLFKYDSPYGIIIDDSITFKKEGNVFYIPKEFFGVL